MWTLSVVTFAVFALLQLLFIADVLEQHDDANNDAANVDDAFVALATDEPAVAPAAVPAAEPAMVHKRQETSGGSNAFADVSWNAVFAPTIVYFVLLGLYVVSSLIYALLVWIGNRARFRSHAAAYNDELEVELRLLRIRSARIHFFDALFDLISLSFGITFLALLIEQLESLSGGDAQLAHRWTTVFVPLLLFLLYAFLLYTIAALRVFGEERYQRSLRSNELCSAACGGALICCADDRAALDEANAARYDKRQPYVDNKTIHACPCVFICARSMWFGFADVIIAWLLYLLPLALFGVALAVAVLLDETTGTAAVNANFMPTNLATIFIVLYVFEIILLVAAICLLLMLLFYYRNRRDRWPHGRVGLIGKYLLSFSIIFIVPFLIAQQALLAQRVDAEIEEEFLAADVLILQALAGNAPDWVRGWHLTFLPTYLLLTIVIVIGYCMFACAKVRARARYLHMRHDAQGNERTIEELQMARESEIVAAGSHYGVLE